MVQQQRLVKVPGICYGLRENLVMVQRHDFRHRQPLGYGLRENLVMVQPVFLRRLSFSRYGLRENLVMVQRSSLRREQNEACDERLTRRNTG